MRCYCCNRNLSDMESVFKHPVTGEYLDTCRKCLDEIGIEPAQTSMKEDTYYDDEDFLEEFVDDENL